MNYADFSLIRFGSGRDPDRAGPASPADLLESLRVDTMARRYPILTTEAAAALAREHDLARRAKRNDEESAAQRVENASNAVTQATNVALARRIARALDDSTGFADRLVQFWSSHFSIRRGGSPSGIMQPAFLDEAIRGNIHRRFGELLRATTLHPSMLIYLDQRFSVGPRSLVAQRQKGRGLNENHARELLELHTLGVNAQYGQHDVRQLAELMTGIAMTPQHRMTFEAKRVEPGAETVLGVEYGGGRPPKLAEFEAFLDDLAVHPATASHISRKLAVHFCADDPPAALLSDLTARFRETDGDLMAIYEVLVSHSESRETFGQKIRQPQDLMIAWLRALSLPGSMVMGWPRKELNRTVLQPQAAMGQGWEGALQPEGWPEEGEVWLTPQFLAARIGWAMREPARLVDPLPDPRAFVRAVFGSTMPDAVAVAASRAESQADGAGVILASPQFNRR